MLLEELLRCQIQEWYPAFRRHTVPTAIIPLPAAFLRYLAGRTAYPGPDGPDEGEQGPLPFVLPTLTSGRAPFPPLQGHFPDPVSLLDRDNTDPLFGGSGSDSDDDEGLPPPAFPELEAAVDAAIAGLGGAALPKLNWSAPKDAVFMAADGTVRCTCFAEVAMLLRASDCVAHDLISARRSCHDFLRAKPVRRNAAEGGLSDPGENCSDGGARGGGSGAPEEDAEQESSDDDETWVDDGFQYYLALRKWYPGLRPESEFRCFVRGRKLVGVSQRDPSAYYPSLPGWSAEVQPKIEDFFEEFIEPQFASENYTFDVYVRADDRVKLIDFNPWGGYTLPLLFTWEELEEEQRGEDELEFRVVMQQGAVRPGLMTAIPYDMLDWGDGSGWDVFLKKAGNELDRQMASLGVDS
ncbi:hypothetical protein CFC21_038804 [Triticum aestivum]|uniref:Cell division cycle protein 123 n=3 Tax=Triticum TaxID=4564 RepID=A0A9R1FDI8_WHEAT|nr:cell division cycle protein 123 homolog isoform X1 [Triticum aestivum]KAF7026704.1 hypothetical protein CFC21_038799 [Triticum aestivum]KAF7026708.1 hypothetical protein CFC21_038804 [Triticum aestivum]VAH70664.1 unnamed protein product [Triticum turgidum subsp. durum]